MISAEKVRQWFDQHPEARCAMCETEKATMFHELWVDRQVPADLEQWTALCAECLRALLGPIPNWPMPDPSVH